MSKYLKVVTKVVMVKLHETALWHWIVIITIKISFGCCRNETLKMKPKLIMKLRRYKDFLNAISLLKNLLQTNYNGKIAWNRMKC